MFTGITESISGNFVSLCLRGSKGQTKTLQKMVITHFSQKFTPPGTLTCIKPMYLLIKNFL